MHQRQLAKDLLVLACFAPLLGLTRVASAIMAGCVKVKGWLLKLKTKPPEGPAW